MALMTLRRKDNDLARLHRDMDDLFGSFLGGFPTWGEKAVWPAIDVTEDENALTVHAEVPGCKAEDIDISVQNNVLTIGGQKKNETEKKEQGYYHIERSYGSFRRDITLPSDVDSAKVEASCKDGVLTVKLPKEEKAKPTKIKVKAQ
jgi:HSP20 family protein